MLDNDSDITDKKNVFIPENSLYVTNSEITRPQFSRGWVDHVLIQNARESSLKMFIEKHTNLRGR